MAYRDDISTLGASHHWDFDGTGSAAASAVASAAGVGYTVGDQLTIVGGASSVAAVFNVDSVGSILEVTGVSLVTAGLYTSTPGNPAATSGGTGSGCTLTVTWDTLFLDIIGTAHATSSGVIASDSAIARDATNCMTINGLTDRVTLPTATAINNFDHTQKAVAGFFETTGVQQPFTRIYGEGNETTSFHFVMGFGNKVLFEIRGGSKFQVQIVTSTILSVNRVYHFCAIFEGNGFGNRVDFFLDGVRQTNAVPSGGQPDYGYIEAHGVGEFADPAGTVGLNGSALLMVAPAAGAVSRYQHWHAYSGAAAALTDTEVREMLFEGGCLADVTISSDTLVNMQVALDALSSTRANAACCIEIEAVTGGGDFTLDLDNLVFDSLASIHIRYNGTADTLTVRNINGSNCSIVSAPFGGSIELVTEKTLTVTAKDSTTLTTIQNVRVLLEAGSGGPLTAGTAIIDKILTDVSGVVTVTFDYAGDQPVTGTARKGDSPYYKTGALGGSVTANGYDAIVFLEPDE